MVDVSGVTSDARPIVSEVARVYLKHTAPWFIGLIVHGSAVKGGAIPGCSDIDFHLYLEKSAFVYHAQLPLELGFAIHRDLTTIELTPFRYIQCCAQTREISEHLVGPIPGAYHLIAGELPVAVATVQQLCASASRDLTELNPAPSFVMSELLGHGGVRLSRSIRLLCTKVWPVLYQVLTMQQDDAIKVWGLSKEKAIGQLPANGAMRQTIERFYQAVLDYYPAEDSLEGAFSIIENGLAFLDATHSWWQQRHAQ